MTGSTGQAAGFWSYTHQDNDQDDGRILRLAERIRAEYSLITGEDLELFIDREGIAWGQEWRQRIDGALDLTTLFIPVITPRYFTREECRRELLRFAAQATALGVEDLLLPIYYVDVTGLKDDSADEAMALIARTQYADWRELRLLEESSAEYRQNVNRLAHRLADVAESAASRPTPDAVAPPTSTAAETEDDEELGSADILAQAEEAMPRWSATIEEFPAVLESLAEVTSKATEDMAQNDRQGKGFASRVQIARRLAGEYDPIADTLQELGRRYSAELREVDPAILWILRQTSESLASGSISNEDRAAAREFFPVLKQLIQASDETIENLRGLISAIGSNLTVSRDLRPVLKRLQVAIRNVVDAQAMIDEWRRQLDEMPPID
jgi:hypothetical protein